MKKLITSVVFFLMLSLPLAVHAQDTAPIEQQPVVEQPLQEEFVPQVIETEVSTEDAALATDEARQASLEAKQRELEKQKKEQDVTQPEKPAEKDKILELFEKRPIEKLSLSNFFAYAVQHSVTAGVPGNTVMLILMLPMLATMVAFSRHVIGIGSLGLYVPIALSITLLATGVAAGMILLLAILLASILAKFLLKKVRIMQLPKVALSMFIVSIFIFLSLTASAKYGFLSVQSLSIFPILLMLLLSEQVIQIQFERSLRETVSITIVTVILGLVGYWLLANEAIRNSILLYPELVLLLIPANILIGRYFGLRLTEYYRFAPMRNGSK